MVKTTTKSKVIALHLAGQTCDQIASSLKIAKPYAYQIVWKYKKTPKLLIQPEHLEKARALIAATHERKPDVITPQHPLQSVFDAVINQVTSGKGTRHGGDSIPFMDQPWAHYAGMHGRGFLTGQAAKKLEEAATTRWGPEFENEMLGAIVYCAMAVLHERENTSLHKRISEGISLNSTAHPWAAEKKPEVKVV